MNDKSGRSYTYKATPFDDGLRLDVVLTNRPEISSRSFASKLIENNKVKVEGKEVNKSHKVLRNQVIEYKIPSPKEAEVEPQNIDIDIVYEDDDLAVINKQAGLVVHPSYGHWDKTLVNALLYHLKNLSGIGSVIRPGIVHRLDKDTSGLMVVAKNDNAHNALSKAIRERDLKREYKALVYGVFKEEKFSVEAPVARHPVDRKKMSVQPNGRYAKTDAQVLKNFDKYSYLKLTLVTGRTHQIRVHLSYIKHPIVGDPVYGVVKNNRFLELKRQFLHAFHLSFKHPKTGKQMDFEIELPKDLKVVLESLS